MRTCHAVLITAVFCMLAHTTLGAEPAQFPAFKTQEIDRSLKVGYGVKLADLSGDGKVDILVADSARVIWFENPDWKPHTIFTNDDKVKADNVCIDTEDLDQDGHLDIVFGAEWQPNNTGSGGSLWWLKRAASKDPRERWTAVPIAASIPTLHRVHFGDVTGDGRAELIVGPLKGRGSTGEKNFTDAPVQVLSYPIPADPVAGPWEPVVLNESLPLHVMHNFWPVDFLGEGKVGVLTASYEGVNYLTPGPDGKWSGVQLGAGNQDNPNASRGSSEVKPGLLGQGHRFIATIDPFHGHQAVVYTAPKDGKGLWIRTVIDEQLKEGHGLWAADFDGDGADEVVVGYRHPFNAGTGPGVWIYKAAPGDPAQKTPTWQKHELDNKGMACEDLACADLNGDGRVDIVAVGRATGNVKIYWNSGGGQLR